METKKWKLLLFDDDIETMQLLQQYLVEDLGWHVELSAAVNLPEILMVERFDLILVDLMIKPKSYSNDGNEIENIQYPGVNWKMTGVEFIKRLRAGMYSSKIGTQADVPVILLSAIQENAIEEIPPEIAKTIEKADKPYRLENLLNQILNLLPAER